MSSAISTILANLRHTVNVLRSAVYAIDVRDDIADAIDDSADAIEQIYGDVNSASLREDAFAAALQDAIDDERLPIPATVIDDNSLPGSKIQQGSLPLDRLAEPVQITVDSALSDSSTNPVQNKVVKGALDELNGSLENLDNVLGWKNVGTADASNEFIYPYHSAQAVRIATQAEADISIHGITVNDFDTIVNPQYAHVEEIESEVGHTYRITDLTAGDSIYDYKITGKFNNFTVGKQYRICLKITDPQNDISGGGHYGAVMVGSTTVTSMGRPTTEERIYTATFTANNTRLDVSIYPFRGTHGLYNYEHAVGDTFRIDDFYINEINGDVDVLSHEKVFQSSTHGLKLMEVLSGGMFVVGVSQNANVSINEAIGRILTINNAAPDATGNITLKSHIQGKTCICFGDSITGKAYDLLKDYPYLMGKITGLNVINVGVSGTTARYRNKNDWDKVCFAHMAEMIESGDFTDLQTMGNTSGFEMKSRCAQIYPILNAVDWDNVDFITVAYGANDHATSALPNVKYLDDETNKLNKNMFLGAMRYSISKILATYPNIKFVVLTPVFRHWTIDGQIVTSDERVFDDGTYYYEWGDALKLCAERELHVPVCDMYNELCINTSNALWFSEDGVHPELDGLAKMAEKLAGCIMSKF